MSTYAKWFFQQKAYEFKLDCAHDKADNDVVVKLFAARLIAGDY